MEQTERDGEGEDKEGWQEGGRDDRKENRMKGKRGLKEGRYEREKEGLGNDGWEARLRNE